MVCLYIDLYIYLLKVKFRIVSSWVNKYHTWTLWDSVQEPFQQSYEQASKSTAKNKVQVNLSASRPFYCSFKPSNHPSSRPGLFHRGMWRNAFRKFMIKHQPFMMVNGISMLASSIWNIIKLSKVKFITCMEWYGHIPRDACVFELPLSPGEYCNLFSKHIQRTECCKP